MAGRTIRCAIFNLVCRQELESVSYLILGLPGHVENFRARTNVLFRMTMAIQAPLHVQRFRLAGERHLIDPAMTRDAADALVHVNAVIEVDEFG